jgi:hypothetical protein
MKNIKQVKMEHYGGNNSGGGGSHASEGGSHVGGGGSHARGGDHHEGGGSHAGGGDHHEGGDRDHHEGRGRDHHEDRGYIYGGGGGWGYRDYPLDYYVYPIFVETPVYVPSSTPSTNNEVMQNIESNNIAKIKFPEKWVFSPEPKRCSYVQARWNNKNELSSDPTCFCPVGNKIEKIINNEKMYKCQINY